MASRKTQRANSSGFTVVLPIDLSVSHASSKAVSKSTSVGGSKELLWNPRMAPSSIVSYGYGHIRVILESFGAKLAEFVTWERTIRVNCDRRAFARHCVPLTHRDGTRLSGL